MTAAPPEEQDLLHWRISPRAFFWRCVALAVLTMLFTLPLLIWLDPITWLLASVLIAVFYMWCLRNSRSGSATAIPSGG